MSVTVNAAAITAPDADTLAAVTTYLAANEPTLTAGVIGAADGVAGETDMANALGAADVDFWLFDAGDDVPLGADQALALMVVELDPIAPTPGDVLQAGATLTVELGAGTVAGGDSGIVALVLHNISLAVLDTAHVIPVADGAANVDLGGIGLAASAALASGDGFLVVGFISDPDVDTESSYDLGSFALTIPTGASTMGSNNSHAQTANCMLIAVELDETCEIQEGATTYVTAGVGKITPTTNVAQGVDYSAENFGGVVCGADMAGETTEKSIALAGEFCLVNWGFMAMTSGNPKIVDGDGNVIGYQQLKRTQSPCSGNGKPRIALTVIRKVGSTDGGCVAPAGSTGQQGQVAVTYPNTTDWVWDIPPHENIRAVVPFKSVAYASRNPGRGPLNLYPAGATPERIDSSALHAEYFVPTESLPTIDDNAVSSHPAPLGKLV